MKIDISTINKRLKELNYFYASINQRERTEEFWFEKSKQYYTQLQNFEQHIFIEACDKWMNEKNDAAPTIAQLRDKCFEVSKKSKTEIIFSDSAPGQLVCEHKMYFMKKGLTQTLEQEECCFLPSIEYLKELVEFHGNEELKNLQESAQFSKKHYGYVLCDFHRALVRVKYKPDCADAFWCQRMVEDNQRYKNKNVEELKNETEKFVNVFLDKKITIS